MSVVLTVIGLCLVGIGVVLLIWFPNRPGGRIALAGIEVTSAGAGLPLIVLGVVCVLSPGTGIPSAWIPWNPADSTTSMDGVSCVEKWFDPLPTERVIPIEAGSENVQILAPGQSKAKPVGLLLEERGRPIGAIKITYFPENQLFKMNTFVDRNCRPVREYSNASRGGDPNTLQNWDTLEMTLDEGRFALRLGYDAGIVDALYFRRISPPG